MSSVSAASYLSSNCEGSKSAASESTRELAMASSAGLTVTSASRIGKSAARTSSGHRSVCKQITLPRTRSTAMDSRWRSATLTTAIRSASSSAPRSSAYGLAAVLSGSR